MWLIIMLIIVGILLLVAELVLLPGISVAGIGAFLSLAVAAVYGFFLYGILGGSVVLAAIIIVAVAAVVVSLRANTWQRLSLKSTIVHPYSRAERHSDRSARGDSDAPGSDG